MIGGGMGHRSDPMCRKLNAEFISKHEEFRSFASSKIVTAVLLQQVNESGFWCKGIQVAKGPVQFELSAANPPLFSCLTSFVLQDFVWVQ
jgi:hypothetical protein